MSDNMIERLRTIQENFQELEGKIVDPEIMKDMENWQKLVKEHADLKPIADKAEEYINNYEIIEGDRELLAETDDPEMKELLQEEIETITAQMEEDREDLRILLLPKDPNDDKNVIIEIRAGAGGDEAGLFAGDLLRMYRMYADSRGWKVDMMDISDQGIGGVKEAVFMVQGDGAYSMLKYESGVHRVQRVPETESSGRIHTSTATVAVLPEADEVDVQIDPNDLRIDVYRSSGNGGQSVNTTDSAVRITHEPTGIVVSCQDEKSQLKNKNKAMKILQSRLYDKMQQEQADEISADRKSQVGTGDRSERIRTYNFPQGRITDHRIAKTVHQLEDFLNGDIQEMIDSLIAEDQTRKLAAVS